MSCANSGASLLGKTVCYVITRPVNLLVWGVTWFHLYSLCQFGGLRINVPVLLLCLLWWMAAAGYGLYLWICYNRRKREAADVTAERGIMSEAVKWFIKRKDHWQIFMKDKSVVIVDVSCLTAKDKDLLDLKLSAVSVLGKRKYRLTAGIFLSVIALYGSFLVVRSAIPYNGTLSWALDDLMHKRSVTFVHDNLYESGVDGILDDIRKKVDLPETLCLATSFNLHFAPDGTIETFDTMLYGFDENGYFTDSYLITYNAARSKKIDVYLHGTQEAVFDIDKDLRPLIETVSLMPLEETVSAWNGEAHFGILYYGTREWNSPEGIRLLNHRGESRLPSAEEYYFSGYSISVFCPDNETNVPVRYLYVGYQEFSAQESAYTADYYPEETQDYEVNGDPEAADYPGDGDMEGAGDRETYVVQEGDTLWKIAGQMLESPFRYAEIYELNKSVIEAAAQERGKKDSGNGRLIFQGTLLQMPEQKEDGEEAIEDTVS